MNLSPLRIPIVGIDNFSKHLSKIQKQTAAMASGMKSAGEKMSAAFSLPIIAGGVAAVAATSKYSDAMADAAASTGATASEMDAMSAAARGLAGIGIGPTKAAEAMKELGRIGMDATQATAALAPVLKMAAAGGLEVADAVGVADGVMDSFGVSADALPGVFDKMFYTSKKAGIGFKAMNDVLGTMGPMFQELGVPLDDALVIMRGFDSAGVDAAKGGAALSKAMAMLTNPTDKVVDGFARLGMSKADIFTDDGKLRDMVGIIDKLAKSGATTADIIGIFGAKAGPAMARLVSQGAGALEGYRSELSSAGGAVDELAQRRLSGLAGVLKRATATLENAAVSIGEQLAPALTKVWNALEPVVVAFTNLPAPVMAGILGFAGLLAVAGPLLVVVSSLITAVSTVGTAIAAAGGIMAILTGPVGLTVLAIAGLIALFIALGDTMKPVYDFVGGAFSGAFAILSAAIKPIWDGLVALWDAFKMLVGILQPVFVLFMALAGLPLLVFLAPLIAAVWAFGQAFKFVANVVKMAVDGWRMLFGVVGDFFKMIDDAMGGPIQAMIKTIGDLVGKFTGGAKVEVQGTPGTPGTPAIPALGGTPAGTAAGAGAAAGAAAVAATAATTAAATQTTVTIDFKNVPAGVTVSQAGGGVKVTGYTGPVMAGA